MKLPEEGKLHLCVAIFLLGEFRKQCLGVDWMDVTISSCKLVEGLGIKQIYDENIANYPFVRIELEN